MFDCTGKQPKIWKDFAKNVRIESYSKKYLSGHLCGDGADRRVDMGCTNSQILRRYVDLIAKQATAQELTLELEVGARSALHT